MGLINPIGSGLSGLGYSDVTYWPTTYTTSSGNRFFKEFWYWSAGMGETVQQAHDIALQNLWAIEHNHWGFDTVVISGEVGGNVVIKPAHYGS